MSSPAPITSTRGRPAAVVPGETNTASNVNVGGVGVFDGKVGVDLQFKGINAGSARITVTDDAGNNEIDVDADESAFDIASLGGTLAHSALSGIGADDHHAQVHVLATTAGLGPDHTTSGLTAGQVLRATGATTAAFASLVAGDIPQLDHGGLAGLTDDDHTQYVHNTTDRTISANHTFSSFTDIDQISTPSDPGAGTRRLFVDSGSGEISVRTSAGATVSLESSGGVTDHGALTGLTDDDHTQYLLLAGRSGGQVATGGTGSASDDLELLPHDQSAATSNTGRLRLNERTVFWEDIPDLGDESIGVALVNATLTQTTTNSINDHSTAFSPFRAEPALTQTAGTTGGLFIDYAAFEAAGSVLCTESDAGQFLLAQNAAVRNTMTQTLTGSGVFYSGLLFHDVGTLTTASNPSTAAYNGLVFVPTLEATSTGTLALSAVTGMSVGPDFDAQDSSTIDCTICRAVLMTDPSVSGNVTIDEVVGLHVANLTAGTTNLSVHSLGDEVEMRHAGYALFGEDAAPEAAVHGHGQSIGSTDPTLKLECTDATSSPEPNWVCSHESVATTDSTVTSIWSLATTTNRAYVIYARVIGRRTDGTTGVARNFRVALYDNTAGTLTERSDANISSATGGTITNNVTYSPSGTTIHLNVQGGSGQTIKWHAFVEYQEVGT